MPLETYIAEIQGIWNADEDYWEAEASFTNQLGDAKSFFLYKEAKKALVMIGKNNREYDILKFTQELMIETKEGEISSV